MTNHDAGAPEGVGVSPRVTSKQVDDVLLNLDGKTQVIHPYLEAICRDWLDMRERLADADRVVANLRRHVAILGDARIVAGEQRSILDEFGVIHAQHDHFLLAQEVMRLRNATIELEADDAN